MRWTSVTSVRGCASLDSDIVMEEREEIEEMNVGDEEGLMVD